MRIVRQNVPLIVAVSEKITSFVDVNSICEEVLYTIASRILSFVTAISLLGLLGSCTHIAQDDKLYECDNFVIYADSIVTQSGNVIRAISDDNIMRGDSLQTLCQRDSISKRYPTIRYGDGKLIAALCNAAFDGIAHANIQDADLHEVYLTTSIVNPELAMQILRSRVADGRVADNASVQTWPIADERAIWTLAANEVYRVTGDINWLKEAYAVAQRSLSEDWYVMYDAHTGLLHGVPLYMIESDTSCLPSWMNRSDMYQCYSLATNVMMCAALQTLNQMAIALGVDTDADISSISRQLATTINDRLWIPDLSRYSAYLYGGYYPIQLRVSDNIGQAYAINHGIASEEMSKRIITATPILPSGIPITSPLLDSISTSSPQHIQSLVQAYWSMAAGSIGNVGAVTVALASSIYGKAIDTNPCNSITLPATLLRGVAGMSLDDNGITFRPCVPWQSGISINGFHYRKAILDITISGIGTDIASFAIDGVPEWSNRVPANIEGHHSIEIVLSDNAPRNNVVRTRDMNVVLPSPTVSWTDDKAVAAPTEDVTQYEMFVNGTVEQRYDSPDMDISKLRGDTYSSIAIAGVSDGEPGMVSRPYELTNYDAISYVTASAIFDNGLADAEAIDAIMMSPAHRSRMEFIYAVPTDGMYLMDMCYACIDTVYARCAVASVEANGVNAGSMVMPCAWDRVRFESGYSNKVCVKLNRGSNLIIISLDRMLNIAIPQEENNALVRHVRITKL